MRIDQPALKPTAAQPLDQPVNMKLDVPSQRSTRIPWDRNAGEGDVRITDPGFAPGGCVMPRPPICRPQPPGVRPCPSQPDQSGMINMLLRIISLLLGRLMGTGAGKVGSAVAGGAAHVGQTKPAAEGTAKLENIGGRPAVRVDGPDGFLWKPVSDGGNKKLVVLLPKDMTANVQDCVIRGPDGKVVGKSNQSGDFNGRGIFRFSKVGGEYPPNSTVEVTLKDGTVKKFLVKDPSVRND